MTDFNPAFPTLSNQHLSLSVNPLGAELSNLYSEKNQQEYLWQGDAEFWSGRATNLFPVCGRFFEGQYSLDGQVYSIGAHGFARQQNFEWVEKGDGHLVFELQASAETLAQWPRDFIYRVSYMLNPAQEQDGVLSSRLQIRFELVNRDKRPLYAALGGHPGFVLPNEKGFAFEDYRLRFSEAKNPEQAVLTDNKLASGDVAPFTRLDENRELGLEHSLFDQDAIFLRNSGSKAELFAPGGKSRICVHYPDFSWLGIWHSCHKPAPFVCLEPWTALCGRDQRMEALEEMPSLTVLQPGEQKAWNWSIEIAEQA